MPLTRPGAARVPMPQNRLAGVVAAQGPAAGHDDAGAVAASLDELTFSVAVPEELVGDVFERLGELGGE